MNDALPIHRRDALRGGAFTAASYARVLGANSRIRSAVVGLGSRGANAHLPALFELPAEIAAICDVFKPRFDRALSLVHKAGVPAPATYSDYRKILDRSDIDAVFIATPEHWHCVMAVDACKAGKDVYVEKPLAHSPEECLAIVDAAKRYNRVVQVGVQQRSMKVYFDALAMLDSGILGRVTQCETAWGWGSGAPVADPATAPPDGLDWEAYQGPARRHPYKQSRQNNWHGYWDYGHGPLTDVGVHVMDVARWFLRLGMPQAVFAAARPVPSPELVPTVVDGLWKYDGAVVTYSSHGEGMTDIFWGEKGSLFVDRARIRTSLSAGRGRAPEVKEIRIEEPGLESVKIPNVRHTIVHIRNFLDCVVTRKTPNAPPEVGAQSTIACLLGAHSMRTGKPCMWDGSRVVEF